VTAAAAKRPPALSSVISLLHVSAYFSFVAAGAIWFVMARDLYRITGIIGEPPTYQAT
jgi:hypothetical protein